MPTVTDQLILLFHIKTGNVLVLLNSINLQIGTTLAVKNHIAGKITDRIQLKHTIRGSNLVTKKLVLFNRILDADMGVSQSQITFDKTL